ncbi:epithelial membrane protein 2-like [Dreissena polymorpha]|uniref:epithelial membrane protein 2-like n=1 Tax=Dreissena polymorpha TaxID=45954 RepID=UPI00226476BB|nr:epithelial membrane protein 2-like [Dreissena polymorpha]
MARLGKYHLGLLFTVLCLILASLALIVTSITTDFWFKVSADDYATPEVKRNFSYSVGMWRRCYNKEMPLGVKAEDRAGDCVYTYKDLTRRAEDNMSSGEYRYLSLERSWVALMITAGGLQLFTIITLILGLWPMESAKAVKRSTLYLIAAIMTLFATMAAMASGICFIGMQELNKTSRALYPDSVSKKYDWSFILGWVATGLCFIEGCMFLLLLKKDHEDIRESGKYSTM